MEAALQPGALQPGTVLASRYRLIRPLARGGMGSVWRAEHIALSSEVAVKIIDPRIATLNMGVARFLREARALAALRSPHIVQVLDFGSDGDIVYLVMELLEGRTLGQRLKAEGKLSPSETKRIMGEVCKAMSHAHERGIVHRDLKPDNIFLCDQSREHVTKVVDFGIAKPIGLDPASNTGTDAGAFLGTPRYMSPEQCRGAKDIDQRSDVWALGAIAYECLLGKRLFEGEVVGDLVVRICTEELPILAHADQLPPGFEAWLHRAMARSPDERFQSATESSRTLAAVLDAATELPSGVDSADTLQGEGTPMGWPLQGTGTVSTLVSPLPRPTGLDRLSKRARVGLAAAALALLAAVAVAALRGGASSARVEPMDAARHAGQTPPASPSGPPGTTTAGSAPPGLSSEVSPTASGTETARLEAPDGGVVPAEAAQKSVKPPVVTRPRAARPPRRTAPAQRTPATAEDPLETEVLRRKR